MVTIYDFWPPADFKAYAEGFLLCPPDMHARGHASRQRHRKTDLEALLISRNCHADNPEFKKVKAELQPQIETQQLLGFPQLSVDIHNSVSFFGFTRSRKHSYPRRDNCLPAGTLS
jgi:hypothetical protein